MIAEKAVDLIRGARGMTVTKPMFYGWILLGVVWFVFAFNLGVPAYGGPVLNTAMGKSLASRATHRV